MKIKFIAPLVNVAGIVTVISTTVIFIACSPTHQTRKQKINAVKSNDSLLIDKDGNKYAIKILLDSNMWMTTNLKLNIPDSYCYKDSMKNCEVYGRLYTRASAIQGCKLLGDEWRLPTNSEWQQLVNLYGGGAEDSNMARKRAYKTLLDSGSSGFNALLGAVVLLIVSTHVWMRMDFIGQQLKLIATQHGFTILQRARRLFINKTAVKKQEHFLFVA